MMMSTLSMVASPVQSPTPVKRESSVESSASLQVQVPEFGRCGVESEEDWTGTGDDWTGTGASSDSGFINFIRSRHENGYLLGNPAFAQSPCTSPPPPLPPKLPPLPPPPSGECHYMNLTSSTMDQDNQYVMINRQELLARQQGLEFQRGGAISEYQRPRPAMTEPALDSTEALANSFTDEDGYCKMVPQRAITRNGSMPNAYPPPVPPHKKQGTPSHFAHPGI